MAAHKGLKLQFQWIQRPLLVCSGTACGRQRHMQDKNTHIHKNKKENLKDTFTRPVPYFLIGFFSSASRLISIIPNSAASFSYFTNSVLCRVIPAMGCFPPHLLTSCHFTSANCHCGVPLCLGTLQVRNSDRLSWMTVWLLDQLGTDAAQSV